MIWVVCRSIIGTSQVDIHNSHNRKYHSHPYSLSPNANANVNAPTSRTIIDQTLHLTAGDFVLGDFPSDDVDMGGDGDGLMVTTPIPVEEAEVADERVREGGWLPSF